MADTKKSYRRGGKKHYANLALKSVESRIKRHITVEVMRDTARVTTIPTRKRETDAGYDVTTPSPLRIQAGRTELVPLGIRVNCPKGYFYEIRGRSSNNRLGFETMDNVIDATYTGELVVKITNNGDTMFRAEVGDRIAQLIFLPQIHVTFKPVEQFTVTEGARGDAGWGSSGKASFPSDNPKSE